MDQFLPDKVSDADLVSRMPEGERAQYNRFGHLWIQSAFAGRIFIVYQPTGLTPTKQHREPNVLTTLEVLDFVADSKNGCSVRIEDAANGAVMAFSHTPRRVFDYDFFMSVPSRMNLRWDAREHDDRIERSMSFAVALTCCGSSVRIGGTRSELGLSGRGDLRRCDFFIMPRVRRTST